MEEYYATRFGVSGRPQIVSKAVFTTLTDFSFQTNVSMPAFYFDTDSFIEGTVLSNYSSGAPVVGNLTLQATFRQFDYKPIKGVKETVITRNLPFVSSFVRHLSRKHK